VFARIIYIFLKEIMDSSNSGKLDHPKQAIHRKKNMIIFPNLMFYCDEKKKKKQKWQENSKGDF
jgi:hypothetical protein